MIAIIMPRQGQSVESCIITKWHVKPGDHVSPGTLLFSYETDKAAFDEEAKESGDVLAILREEGDDVPVLEPVAVIGETGEDVGEYLRQQTGSAQADQQAAPSAPEAPAPAQPDAPAEQAPATDGAKASPRARQLATARGVDLRQASPTGPQGRIIARDVEALISAGSFATPAAMAAGITGGGSGIGGRASVRDAGMTAQAAAAPAKPVAAPVQAAPETRDEPLPNIRKVIARTMYESLSTMAQLTHTVTYDATDVLALRAQFKARGEAYGMARVTIGDLIVFAVTRTLMQPGHAHLNAHFLGDSIRYFRDVQLGIAVDTPRGLMVPTLRNANRKTLLEISNETKALAAACQSGQIDPDLLTGGSFTVSNLGNLEIEHFTPVINPPQTGILGVNTIQQRVREEGGEIRLYPAMSLSLTYDHRALDGAPASRFLRDLKRNLENIQMLLGGGALDV